MYTLGGSLSSLEQAFGRGNEIRENCFSQLAIVCLMNWKPTIFSKDGPIDLLTLSINLSVSLGTVHSLNGDSPSFLWDLRVYLRTMGEDPVKVAIFLSTCLIEEDVSLYLLSSFSRRCVGMSSFGTWRIFFVPPLSIEIMVDDMISLGASFSTKNLHLESETQPSWMVWHYHSSSLPHLSSILHIGAEWRP